MIQMKKILSFLICSVILTSVFSFDDVDENKAQVELEKFGLKVYNSIKENSFKDFYKLYITREELKDFLKGAEVDDDRLQLRIGEYDTFCTKPMLEKSFSYIQECPNHEGVSWSETTLKNQVKKIIYAPLRGEDRVVVQFKNHEFVIFCTEIYYTKNGWKLNAMPSCISIQAQKEQFKIWQKEGENER